MTDQNPQLQQFLDNIYIENNCRSYSSDIYPHQNFLLCELRTHNIFASRDYSEQSFQSQQNSNSHRDINDQDNLGAKDIFLSKMFSQSQQYLSSKSETYFSWNQISFSQTSSFYQQDSSYKTQKMSIVVQTQLICSKIDKYGLLQKQFSTNTKDIIDYFHFDSKRRKRGEGALKREANNFLQAVKRILLQYLWLLVQKNPEIQQLYEDVFKSGKISKTQLQELIQRDDLQDVWAPIFTTDYMYQKLQKSRVSQKNKKTYQKLMKQRQEITIEESRPYLLSKRQQQCLTAMLLLINHHQNRQKYKKQGINLYQQC